jgi:hypothetical protein
MDPPAPLAVMTTSRRFADPDEVPTFHTVDACGGPAQLIVDRGTTPVALSRADFTRLPAIQVTHTCPPGSAAMEILRAPLEPGISNCLAVPACQTRIRLVVG